MDKAASEVLELIKEGTTAIGKVGVEFWPELVRYHIAMVVATFAACILFVLLGLTVFSVMVYRANNLGRKHVFENEDPGFPAGVALVISGIMLIPSTINGFWMVVALSAPQAYTVMQLLGK